MKVETEKERENVCEYVCACMCVCVCATLSSRDLEPRKGTFDVKLTILQKRGGERVWGRERKREKERAKEKEKERETAGLAFYDCLTTSWNGVRNEGRNGACQSSRLKSYPSVGPSLHLTRMVHCIHAK